MKATQASIGVKQSAPLNVKRKSSRVKKLSKGNISKVTPQISTQDKLKCSSSPVIQEEKFSVIPFRTNVSPFLNSAELETNSFGKSCPNDPPQNGNIGINQQIPELLTLSSQYMPTGNLTQAKIQSPHDHTLESANLTKFDQNCHENCTCCTTFINEVVPIQVANINSDSPSDRKVNNKLYTSDQCLIIKGIAESHEVDPKARISYDLGQFKECAIALLKKDERIEVLKAYRLGKFEPDGKCRPLKLVLRDENQRNLLLQRKNLLQIHHSSVFFQREYTPKERQKYRDLYQEMQFRISNGESGLIIKQGKVVVRNQPYLWENPVLISI
jgi:hypothetical protein